MPLPTISKQKSKKPLNVFRSVVTVYGRVPFFYYVVHMYLTHILALLSEIITGYHWSDMILVEQVNSVLNLKGSGFNLIIVYIVWMGLMPLLYPAYKWFARFKRPDNPSKKWGLGYTRQW